MDTGSDRAGVFHALGRDTNPRYLFGRPADQGSWWGTVLYTIVPNWQNFWLADALDSGRSTFHWGYVGKAFVYAACYIGATLAAAVVLFEDRELS